MREAIEFTCTITLIWQLVGPIIKQLQLHPTPPLIGIPDESALFEWQTFRLNDSLPFYSKPSKHLMIKNPKKKFVSELRLDKNEKRTQFTPIFES